MLLISILFAVVSIKFRQISKRFLFQSYQSSANKVPIKFESAAYFNLTGSTADKVSTNLIQTAQLVLSPTPW